MMGRLAAWDRPEWRSKQLAASGELRRVTRGVYIDTHHGVDRWLECLAGLITRYPDGRIAGETAAALFSLDGFDPGAPALLYRPLTTSGRHVLVRRRVELADPVWMGEIRVCGVEELLVGLGAEVRPRPGCAAARTVLDNVDLVELALESALRLGLTDIDRLESTLRNTPRNRPGRSVLALLLAHRPAGLCPTGSYLETRAVQVWRHGSLPPFQRQVTISDEEGIIGTVDFLHQSVVFELVGKKWHLERFHPDHHRYARIEAAGYRLVPFTFDDVEFDPAHVLRATSRSIARNLPSVGHSIPDGTSRMPAIDVAGTAGSPTAAPAAWA